MPPGRLSRRTYLKVTAAALAAPADWLLARAARAGGEASVRVRTNVPWTTKHQTHSVTVSRFYDVWNRGPGEPWRPGLEALRAIVREAESAGAHLRAVGAGWSLSDAALTDGFLVNTMPLNHQRIGLAPDEVTAAITDRQHLVFAQCGASILELNHSLESRGLSLPTSGASNGQTICGAMSTGTHGSALSVGAVQDYVAGIHLIGEGGRHYWMEPPAAPVVSDGFCHRLGATPLRDERLFRAALVSFGSFGIIHAVLLRVEPIYHLQHYRYFSTWQAVLPYLTTPHDVGSLNRSGTGEQPFHFEVLLNPYARDTDADGAVVRVLYKRPGPPPPSDIHGAEVTGKPGPDVLGTIGKLTDVITPLSRPIVATLLKRLNEPVCGELRTHGQTFGPTEIAGRSLSAEIGVPADRAREATQAMRDVARDVPFVGILALRYVKKSEALVAFTRFQPTCTIELPAPGSRQTRLYYEAVCQRLDERSIPFTLHWGQWNGWLDPARVRKMWGDEAVEQWLAARRTFLPGSGRRTFCNALLERCGLAD